jgi:hypothetical protein
MTSFDSLDLELRAAKERWIRGGCKNLNPNPNGATMGEIKNEEV